MYTVCGSFVIRDLESESWNQNNINMWDHDESYHGICVSSPNSR